TPDLEEQERQQTESRPKHVPHRLLLSDSLLRRPRCRRVERLIQRQPRLKRSHTQLVLEHRRRQKVLELRTVIVGRHTVHLRSKLERQKLRLELLGLQILTKPHQVCQLLLSESCLLPPKPKRRGKRLRLRLPRRLLPGQIHVGGRPLRRLGLPFTQLTNVLVVQARAIQPPAV